ncbi:hypothetical protein Scep_008696 [Stephania cephalantha]|uniref:Uncharacterized protein n=1 Tax=Stephania cephalantha TaxID=152367 RepID=A0AAP0PFM6_9MAGN
MVSSDICTVNSLSLIKLSISNPEISAQCSPPSTPLFTVSSDLCTVEASHGFVGWGLSCCLPLRLKWRVFMVSAGARVVCRRAASSRPSSSSRAVRRCRLLVPHLSYIGHPGFKFDCAAAISDRLELLGNSSLQGRRISKVEFLKSRKGVVKLKWVYLPQINIKSPSKRPAAKVAHTCVPGFDATALTARSRASAAAVSLEPLPLLAHTCVPGFDATALIARSRASAAAVSLEPLPQAKLQRRRQELTQATLDQSVDYDAVYYNVAGECPRGRVYSLGSLGRKKIRYADPGASTSQMPDMVSRSEFDSVAEQLRQTSECVLSRDTFGLVVELLPPDIRCVLMAHYAVARVIRHSVNCNPSYPSASRGKGILCDFI